METRIAELREAQGMKCTKLATRAGVGYGQLTKWENATKYQIALIIGHTCRKLRF